MLLPYPLFIPGKINRHMYSRWKYYCYHQNAKYFLLPFKLSLFLAKVAALNPFASIFVEYCRLVHGFFSVLLPIWYSYRSSIYCDSNSCLSFTLLKVLAKSNGNRARKSDNYRDSWKSDNFWERAIKKEAKNWYQISQYWKNEWLDGNIFISYFGGSNNIFF